MNKKIIDCYKVSNNNDNLNKLYEKLYIFNRDTLNLKDKIIYCMKKIYYQLEFDLSNNNNNNK